MRIYVDNLHPHASERQLKDLFQFYGSVEVEVVMDENGHSMGYAWVYMQDRDEGLNAIRNLHQQNFMNQFIVVSEMQEGHRQRITKNRDKDDKGK